MTIKLNSVNKLLNSVSKLLPILAVELLVTEEKNSA